MVRQKKIELTIPTIDLSLAKRIKGGYSPSVYDIEPSYCYGSYDTDDDDDDPRDHDDDYRRDFEENDDNDYESSQQNDHDDSAHEDDNHEPQNENPPIETKLGNITLVNFSNENVQFIINSINNLPTMYHDLNVRIESKSISNGSANFLPGVITLGLNSDGTVNVGSLHEELNHTLQHQKYGDDMTSHSRSAFEYQAKMMEDLVQQAFGLPFDDFFERSIRLFEKRSRRRLIPRGTSGS